MRFEKVTIDNNTPGTENDVCLIADVNGNGYNDIIIGGKYEKGNVVWYEYPTWKRHTIGTAQLEAGGAAHDLTGNGLPDIIVGNPYETKENTKLFWFENTGEHDKEWPMHLITDKFIKYHDQAVGDLNNDGKPEVIFSSQASRVLGYFDIPDDPRVSPWPDECLHIIAEDIEEEGLAVVDIDGDGQNELIAGPNVFKLVNGVWERTQIEGDFNATRVAVGDINGDGKLEIVLSEGEKYPARLAWISAYPDYKVNIIADDFFHPHSLQLADFNGDGTLDIFIAEMGLGRNPHDPRVMIYQNKGNCQFEPLIVDPCYATHDSKAGDIGNTGRMSIVGKPYNPGRNVDLWINKE